VPQTKELSCRKDPKEIPPPSLNSTIKNTPNIAGLTPECAKIVWYNLALQDPPPAGAISPYATDTLIVTFKQHVSKEKGMKIIYSPEANGTLFSEYEDSMWESYSAPKAYAGRWNYTQMCYFEHLPEVVILTVCCEILLIFLQVSHVGLIRVNLGFYGLGMRGYAW
jgi:hypothetical protein